MLMRMKKKEMIAAAGNGTEVAVYEGGRGKGEVPRSARRALILAVGQNRKVSTGARWDIGGHTARDGVRVRFLDDPQPGFMLSVKRGEETVVGPTAVLAPWPTYERERDAFYAQVDAEKARVEAIRVRAEAAAQALGGSVRTLYEGGIKPRDYQVLLTPERAEEIAALIAGGEDQKDEEPCYAILYHGPGHQSRTRCEKTGPHEIHECHYGEFDSRARWRDNSYIDRLKESGEETWPSWVDRGTAMTGFFDEAPELDEDEEEAAA